MAKEVTTARESGASPLNATGRASRRSVKDINRRLDSVLNNGGGLNHYAKYGDIQSAEFHDDGTLEVWATGKAYGDRRPERGTAEIMSDSEYRASAPRFYKNFRGEETVSDVGITYAANTIVRDIRKMGRIVKKIRYDYGWD